MSHLTYPVHAFDWIFWPVLARTLEKKTRKISHGWHWRPWDEPVVGEVKVAGDPSAPPARNAWESFLMRNFRWRHVAVIEPEDMHGCSFYRAGFSSPGKAAICSILVRGPVGLLIGDGDVSFFTIGLQAFADIPLRTKLLRVTDKKSLPEEIPLL